MGDKRPAVFDRLTSTKKPVTRKVPICLDSELADEFNELSMRLFVLREDVKSSTSPAARRDLEDAEAEMEELRPKMEEATVTFTFRSLGRTAFEELLDEHPPTKQQNEKARRKGEDPMQFNPDTFPQALVAACIVEPDLSYDEVKQLFDDANWNTAELTALWEAAFTVNQQRRVVDLGKG